MVASMVTVAKKLELCPHWIMLRKIYNKQSSPEVLQCSYRYVINLPEKVLIFIILIEGVVTGITGRIWAIIQPG